MHRPKIADVQQCGAGDKAALVRRVQNKMCAQFVCRLGNIQID